MMLQCDSKTAKMPRAYLSAAYGVFLLGAASVWHLVADGEFSAILTVSVMLQCLGFMLLGLRMLTSNGAAGVSARALALDALALCFRLSSTLWLNGYLPVDASGDYIFQMVDICSLALVCWLLYQVLVVKRSTYQAEEDSLPIIPMVAIAIVLAGLFHGNMNNRPMFDTFWMAGLFVSVIAVMPQLWFIMKTGGKIEALTSHYIAAMAAGRALSGLFMWHARGDITCVPFMEGFNHAIWAILGAHLIHLLLLGDFAYHYGKAVLVQGLACRIDVSESCGV